MHHLRSKKWDTRVAAAHAIGAIVLNVKHTSLSELLNSLATKLGEAGMSDSVDEVVALRNLQSKILANAPFRRLLIALLPNTYVFLSSTVEDFLAEFLDVFVMLRLPDVFLMSLTFGM